MADKIGCIILAAGIGSRMNSNIAKPLHRVAGLSMVSHVIKNAKALNPEKIVVVIAKNQPEMEEEVKPHTTVIQEEVNGTGGAVLVAKEHFKDFDGDILVLYGDSPLISTVTMQEMIDACRKSPEVGLTFSGMFPENPARYGRMIIDDNDALEKIVEFKDATDEEKEITLCNGGIVCADGSKLFKWLEQVDNNNTQGEYYLTDLPAIARKDDRITHVVEVPVNEMAGANSFVELAILEKLTQKRLREKHMLGGAKLIDPDTVYFNHDTVIGKGVIIEPNVFFDKNVTVADNVLIKAYSHIDGATIGEGAIIGPFARIRPGTEVGEKAKVCNFVEVKKSKIGKGSKVNHLAYIGDTTIGNNSNIGAGTIVCNYDGVLKYNTTIGDNVMVGSNSTLIAPVNIADNSFVGAGSVINKDTKSDELAITRGEQKSVSGWVKKFRISKQQEKDALK